MSHRYQQPGDYIITVNYTLYSDCFDPTYYSHTLPIHVHDQAVSITDTVVCGEVCDWNGHLYYETGQYAVTFPDVGYCDSVAKLNINAFYQFPHPEASFEYDCDLHKCILHASGDGDYFFWSCTPNNPELQGHEYDTLLMVTPNTAREYRLYMANWVDTLCGSDTLFIIPQINVFEAVIDASPTMVDYDHTSVILTDLSPNTNERVWYADDYEIGRSQKVEYSYPVSHDSVIIKLAASSIYGCRDTTELPIYLVVDGIYAPNIITPTLHQNNYFQVIGSSLMDGEIWIYNREGALVWYSTDVHEKWDATHEGRPLMGGTYVYHIRYRQTIDPGVWLRKTGTVTVVR